jgi:glycosyltransferase involved in cell wall biosynthesis
MSQGCPLVCSETSSFPEVASDAAEYFNPNEVMSMRVAMSKVIESDFLRKDLVKKGYSRNAIFSWSVTVKKHFEFYKEVLTKV